MAVGRAARREGRRPQVAAAFDPEQVEPALELLELMELAWHDCYGTITPSEEQVDDMILLADGTITGLVFACRLAVTDWRDLQVLASKQRRSGA